MRLRAEPGTPDFAEEYQAAERIALGIAAPPMAEGRVVAGSLKALFLAYCESPQFKSKSPATKLEYKRTIEALYPKYGDLRVATMPSSWVQMRQDELAETPRKANRFVVTLRLLINWGIKRGWRPDQTNPTAPVDLLPTGAGYRRWTTKELATMLSPSAREIGMPVLIAYYTAQRLGDVLAMRWADYNGHAITLTQQKTKTSLIIPAHPTLKAELDKRQKALKKEGRIEATLATRPDGKPWLTDHYKHRFAAIKNELGLAIDLHFHGLRHSAAANLAEAGCTAHEISSITGHKTLSMVSKYTGQVVQNRLAESAVAKLSGTNTRTKVTNRRIKID